PPVGGRVLLQLLSGQPWRLPKHRDLLDLFDKGKSPSTLKVYLSAISAILAFHVNKSVELEAFHSPPFQSDGELQLHTLCSVQTLAFYVDGMKSWRKSDGPMVKPG
ncbi:UNVERIFIED_CONTAM: hypothetical protein FKN15_054837, partial [Acipenser sinensis]